MNILVTGGAGFIGSNFIKYLLSEEKDIHVVNLDALTYAGNLSSLEDIEADYRYTFIHGDIRDKAFVQKVVSDNDIDTIINFAAESHVDNSISNPDIFIETNINGTHNLIQAAKDYWQTGKDDLGYPVYKPGTKFLQVSTDEVYGSLGADGFFTETTPLNPNSPYSASKTSADLLVRAYHQTFAFPANITRCSNNYGPYQYPEKLIPLMINNILSSRDLPVYGDGLQIRDWLYVEDHCRAIWTVVKKGVIGEVYNIGGNNEKANIDIVNLLLEELEGDWNLIKHVEDRLGHDRRYAIDSTKIMDELGWKPTHTFNSGIKATSDWYVNNKHWLEEVKRK